MLILAIIGATALIVGFAVLIGFIIAVIKNKKPIDPPNVINGYMLPDPADVCWESCKLWGSPYLAYKLKNIFISTVALTVDDEPVEVDYKAIYRYWLAINRTYQHRVLNERLRKIESYTDN